MFCQRGPHPVRDQARLAVCACGLRILRTYPTGRSAATRQSTATYAFTPRSLRCSVWALPAQRHGHLAGSVPLGLLALTAATSSARHAAIQDVLAATCGGPGATALRPDARSAGECLVGSWSASRHHAAQRTTAAQARDATVLPNADVIRSVASDPRSAPFVGARDEDTTALAGSTNTGLSSPSTATSRTSATASIPARSRPATSPKRSTCITMPSPTTSRPSARLRPPLVREGQVSDLHRCWGRPLRKYVEVASHALGSGKRNLALPGLWPRDSRPRVS